MGKEKGEGCGVPRLELARARRQRGLSQKAAAEKIGVASTTWSRWEQGAQGVRAGSRRRLAELFEVSPIEVERWIDGWSFGETSSWPVTEYGDTSTAATVRSAALLWRYEMDETRRHLLASLPFVPAALGEWLTAWNYGVPPQTVAQRGTNAMVGMADVERINEARKVFGQMDSKFGPKLVRPVVVGYLDKSVTPLLRGRYDDRVGAALMSAAAGMTLMAGWTAFDMNLHGQAQQHFGQALRLAKTGDDPLTGVWVLAAMTKQATQLEQATWAPWLARAAVDTARRAQAPPRVMALILIKEAKALALQTNPAETRDQHSAKQIQRLLAEAESAYAQGPTDRDPGWITEYDAAELGAQAGSCWRLLGDHARAAACAETAVTSFNGRLPRGAQLNRVNAAGAYLGMGELEQAIDLARAAIPATKALNSARSTERLQKFADELDPYSSSIMVRQFRDQLHSELAA